MARMRGWSLIRMFLGDIQIDIYFINWLRYSELCILAVPAGVCHMINWNMQVRMSSDLKDTCTKHG